MIRRILDLFGVVLIIVGCVAIMYGYDAWSWLRRKILWIRRFSLR